MYYKKLNMVLWANLVATVQTPTITEYAENDHCFYCAKWQRFLEQTGLTQLS